MNAKLNFTESPLYSLQQSGDVLSFPLLSLGPICLSCNDTGEAEHRIGDDIYREECICVKYRGNELPLLASDLPELEMVA